jgi:sugar/nucleoside kinase (ribokinase family)
MRLCAFGELLIDVTPYGRSEKGYPVCEFNPGGAPANVAVACVNLGLEASFIGQVGDDHYGRFLRDVLNQKGVDTNGLLLSPSAPTSLAIVSLSDTGERSFSFYRKHGADIAVTFNSVFRETMDRADAFHCGSVSLSDEPARTATLDMLKYAHSSGKPVSFDVNLRPLLWDDLTLAKSLIEQALPFVDILKVSDEELLFLQPGFSEMDALKAIAQRYPITMIVVTSGEHGSAVYTQGALIRQPSFRVEAVDTTGAGDAFFGAFLQGIYTTNLDLESFSESQLRTILRNANACGAITTLTKGAIGALPTAATLNAFLASAHENKR